jgi:uncharacterized phage-associated protein
MAICFQFLTTEFVLGQKLSDQKVEKVCFFIFKSFYTEMSFWGQNTVQEKVTNWVHHFFPQIVLYGY